MKLLRLLDEDAIIDLEKVYKISWGKGDKGFFIKFNLSSDLIDDCSIQYEIFDSEKNMLDRLEHVLNVTTFDNFL